MNDSTTGLTSSERVGSAVMSRAVPRRGDGPRSAAPVRTRDRARSRRHARPGRAAATVLVVGLLLLGAAAAEAQTSPRILVSNSAVPDDDNANTSGNDHAQLFHTGGNTLGYILTSVHVNSDDAENDDFDVEICEEDGSADEFPTSACTALTAPGSFTTFALAEFKSAAGLALSANTNYVVVIKQRGTGSVRLKSTTNTGEDTSIGLSDWSIKDKFYWKSGSTWMIKSGTNEALRIIVNGYARVVGDATDATLSALSVSGATLSPAFDAGTTTYGATVANSVSQGTITATKSEWRATLEYLDESDATRMDADTMTAGLQVNLNMGTNTVKVKVTAPDTTTTQTYTVNIVRGAVVTPPPVFTIGTEIWSATLTVGSRMVASVTFLGWNDSGNFTGASLTDQNFTFGGDTYDLDQISLEGGALKRFSDSPCTAWARRGTSACTNAGGPMQAYSMDLRERALLDSDAGMKAADVAVKYRVSGSWVRLLKQRRRETGDVAPRVQRHGRRRMLEPHLHTLAALTAEQPDRTVAELKDALGTPASLATIWRAVAALDVTVKKNGPALRTRST